jgi:hypothetical protein
MYFHFVMSGQFYYKIKQACLNHGNALVVS